MIFSIHPRYKHDVGYRLSRAGLAIAYNQSIEFLGPLVFNVVHSTESHTINITYTAVKSIELRSQHGFEVRIIIIIINCFHKKNSMNLIGLLSSS